MVLAYILSMYCSLDFYFLQNYWRVKHCLFRENTQCGNGAADWLQGPLHFCVTLSTTHVCTIYLVEICMSNVRDQIISSILFGINATSCWSSENIMTGSCYWDDTLHNKSYRNARYVRYPSRDRILLSSYLGLREKCLSVRQRTIGLWESSTG